jgi:phenylacetate-CoA ligase
MGIEDNLYKYLYIYRKLPDPFRKMAGHMYKYIPLSLRYGPKYKYFVHLINKSAYWDIRYAHKYQLDRLNQLLFVCKNEIPFYNDRLSNVKLPLESIEEYQNVVPFTSKDELRNNINLFKNPKIPSNKLITSSTGGTTGEPLKFYMMKGVNRTNELAHMNDLWGRIGYSDSDLRMVFRSGIVSNPKTDHKYWFDPIKNRIFVSSFNLSTDDIKLYVDLINQFKPTYLHVYPSVLTIVCNKIANHKIKINHFPKGILCGSEHALPGQIELFKQVFKCKICRWYGLGEEASLAGSCEYNLDYHPYPTYSFTELIDTYGNNIDQEDKVGEIVGTPFYNYAMPILRYKTQDYAIYKCESCKDCNRNGPIFKQIIGREQEKIYDYAGNEYSLGPFLFGIHDELWSKFSAIQFVQKNYGDITVVTNSENLSDIEQIDYLKKQLEPRFNANFKITYKPNDNIIRSSIGKISLQKPQASAGRFFGRLNRVTAQPMKNARY